MPRGVSLAPQQRGTAHKEAIPQELKLSLFEYPSELRDPALVRALAAAATASAENPLSSPVSGRPGARGSGPPSSGFSFGFGRKREVVASQAHQVRVFDEQGNLTTRQTGVHVFQLRRETLFFVLRSLSWINLLSISMGFYLLILAGITSAYYVWAWGCGARDSTSVVNSFYFTVVSLAANGGYMGEDMDTMGDPRHICYRGRSIIVMFCSYANIVFVGLIAALVVGKAEYTGSLANRIEFSDFCTLARVPGRIDAWRLTFRMANLENRKPLAQGRLRLFAVSAEPLKEYKMLKRERKLLMRKLEAMEWETREYLQEKAEAAAAAAAPLTAAELEKQKAKGAPGLPNLSFSAAALAEDANMRAIRAYKERLARENAQRKAERKAARQVEKQQQRGKERTRGEAGEEGAAPVTGKGRTGRKRSARRRGTAAAADVGSAGVGVGHEAVAVEVSDVAAHGHRRSSTEAAHHHQQQQQQQQQRHCPPARMSTDSLDDPAGRAHSTRVGRAGRQGSGVEQRSSGEVDSTRLEAHPAEAHRHRGRPVHHLSPPRHTEGGAHGADPASGASRTSSADSVATTASTSSSTASSSSSSSSSSSPNFSAKTNTDLTDDDRPASPLPGRGTISSFTDLAGRAVHTGSGGYGAAATGEDRHRSPARAHGGGAGDERTRLLRDGAGRGGGHALSPRRRSGKTGAAAAADSTDDDDDDANYMERVHINVSELGWTAPGETYLDKTGGQLLLWYPANIIHTVDERSPLFRFMDIPRVGAGLGGGLFGSPSTAHPSGGGGGRGAAQSSMGLSSRKFQIVAVFDAIELETGATIMAKHTYTTTDIVTHYKFSNKLVHMNPESREVLLDYHYFNEMLPISAVESSTTDSET